MGVPSSRWAKKNDTHAAGSQLLFNAIGTDRLARADRSPIEVGRLDSANPFPFFQEIGILTTSLQQEGVLFLLGKQLAQASGGVLVHFAQKSDDTLIKRLTVMAAQESVKLKDPFFLVVPRPRLLVH